MKKLFLMMMVAGSAFAFTACGGQKHEEASEETETMEAPAEEPAEEEAPAMEESDSTMVETDSAAAE